MSTSELNVGFPGVNLCLGSEADQADRSYGSQVSYLLHFLPFVKPLFLPRKKAGCW